MTKNEEAVKNDMFGFGDKNVAFAKYFIGTSYLNGLVSPDDNIDINVSNVNFEPGCRNDWHIHHDGFQILLVTAGEGWYQEEGKPAQLLKSGDVVAMITQLLMINQTLLSNIVRTTRLSVAITSVPLTPMKAGSCRVSQLG